MKNKKIIGLVLVGSLVCGSLFGYADVNAAAKKKFIVGNKTVNAESGITRNSAYSQTMSDGTVKSTISSEYKYTLNGKKTKTGKVTNSNTITYLRFTAPAGGTSLTITSHHTFKYAGDTADGYTTAAY